MCQRGVHALSPFAVQKIFRHAAINMLPGQRFIEIALPLRIVTRIDTGLLKCFVPVFRLEPIRPAVKFRALLPRGVNDLRDAPITARQDRFQQAGRRIVVAVVNIAAFDLTF